VRRLQLKRRHFVLAWLALVLIGGCWLWLSAANDGRTAGRAEDENAAFGMLVGTFEADNTTLEDCQVKEKAQLQQCFDQAFGNLVVEQGPSRALDELDSRVRDGFEDHVNCHRIAHSMGAAAVASSSGDSAAAMAAGRVSCASGYYHGVVERAFVGIPKDQVAEAARDLCRYPPDRRDNAAVQCLHGLGHGLMLRLGYELPAVVKACELIPTAADQDQCFSGAFMENYTGLYGAKSPWLRDDDLFFPCTEMKDRAESVCYTSTAARIAVSRGYQLDQIAPACRKAPADRWVEACFRNFGELVAEQARAWPMDAVRGCALAGKLLPQCVTGAVNGISARHGSSKQAFALCARLLPKARPGCYYDAGNAMITTSAFAGRADPRLCSPVPRGARQRCMDGLSDAIPSSAHA
jgi:hypothetical protein